MKRWMWGAGICALLVGCDEDWGAGRTGKSQGAQSGVPACAEPTHRLSGGPDNGWQRRAPDVWFGLRYEGGEEISVDFDGETLAEPWPESLTLPSRNTDPLWLPLPEGNGEVALPSESVIAGVSYQVRLRRVSGAYGGWSVLEVSVSAGEVRVLSVGGQVYPSQRALESLGWTVQFNPVCWTRDCSDPYLHHDVILKKGQQTWYLAHGKVAEINAGGRPFRVYNDAAGLPGKGARLLCSGSTDSSWSLVILALD